MIYVNLDVFIASTKITSLNIVETVIWKIGDSHVLFGISISSLTKLITSLFF